MHAWAAEGELDPARRSERSDDVAARIGGQPSRIDRVSLVRSSRRPAADQADAGRRSWIGSRGLGSDSRPGPAGGPVLHSRPVRDPRGPSRRTARATQVGDGAHTRTVPTGTVPAPSPTAHGPVPGDGVRGGTNRQEVAHRAVRFDAAAARGRSPLRPPDAPLESQDAPVHLRGAQRDPHHRPRPDRRSAWTSPSSPSARPSPAASWSCSSGPRSRPRSRSPRRRPAPACRTSTSAGSAACSPTS